jgi:hypothetical protein
VGVGGGTQTVTEKFGVNGVSYFNGNLRIQGTNGINFNDSGFTKIAAESGNVIAIRAAGARFTSNGTSNILNMLSSGLAGDVIDLFDTDNFKFKKAGTSTLTEFARFGTNLLYADIQNDKVGIGTTAPSEKLHIEAGNALIKSSGSDVSLFLQNNLDQDRAVVNYDSGLDTGEISLSNSAGEFFNASDGFVGVGVGANTPNTFELLRLNGNANISGGIAIGGSTSLTSNSINFNTGGSLVMGGVNRFRDVGSNQTEIIGNTLYMKDAGGNDLVRFTSGGVSGETRLMVWDIDNATLERVTVGAADSGGAGFKVLRIPN